MERDDVAPKRKAKKRILIKILIPPALQAAGNLKLNRFNTPSAQPRNTYSWKATATLRPLKI